VLAHARALPGAFLNLSVQKDSAASRIPVIGIQLAATPRYNDNDYERRVTGG